MQLFIFKEFWSGKSLDNYCKMIGDTVLGFGVGIKTIHANVYIESWVAEETLISEKQSSPSGSGFCMD